ncbi:MAG: hypothetical protein AABX71_02810 [Nanoarchaeota archaeon]
MKKKAQFKIQQMALMLIAVVLFFILVGLFWLALQYRNLQKQALQLEESKSILLSEFLSSSTEFSCGSYCIDTDKMMVLIDRKVYYSLWPVSYIKLRKICPGGGGECNRENYPNCSIYSVYEKEGNVSRGEIGSFVALCRYEKIGGYAKRVCDLGKLGIGYEIK